MTGDLEMHPLFLTIANINSQVRMKTTSHAWSCIIYTPSPEFIVHPDFQSVLEARVWHRCLDIVCIGLKLAARTGTFMNDPNSVTQYCFTPLATYIADLPEQLMIACVTKSVLPISLAEQNQFGDGIPYAPRDGELTLEILRVLCAKIDPWRLQEFLAAAKKAHLSGVQLPFWRDWRFSNPSIFLIREILHTIHKFFFDHPFKWCKEVLGHDELDARYRMQHRRVGTRHFNGVSHVKQMTGRDHRDLQRTVVATIAGCAEPDFVRAIHAIIDFIYQAQALTFTPSSIHAMKVALSEFHAFKGAILQAGAWRGKSKEINHFSIPKLEILQSFSRSICNVGCLIQYTTDVSEHLLKTHCKDPFTRTNRQRAGFTQQVVRLLDREESIRHFDLYSLLLERNANLTNDPRPTSDDPRYVDPTLDWVQCVAPDEVTYFHGPRNFRNHFLTGMLSDDSKSALHVTIKADFADKSPRYIAETYRLSDFPDHLRMYIDTRPDDVSYLHGRLLKGWNKFRLQSQSRLHPLNIIPSQQVQAFSPSEEFPFGKCDTVLVDYTPPTGIPSECSVHYAVTFAFSPFSYFSVVVVTQIRAIFAFSSRGSALPPDLSHPLLYIQFFTFAANPADQPHVGMYTIQRMFLDNPDGSVSRMGAIISLLDVIHAVELIPKYGVAARHDVTSETCLELHDEFYMNNFTDKEWYYTMYHDYQ